MVGVVELGPSIREDRDNPLAPRKDLDNPYTIVERDLEIRRDGLDIWFSKSRSIQSRVEASETPLIMDGLI
jgi:hypothetical protein